MNALHFIFGKYHLFYIQVAGPYYWDIYDTNTLYSTLSFQMTLLPKRMGLTLRKIFILRSLRFIVYKTVC